MSRCSFLFALAMITLVGCTRKQHLLPFYNTPDFTPLWLTEKQEIEEAITHKIADFSFTNQEGNTITNEDVDGKIYVANFFFTTCPGICPKMTNHFEAVQEAFVDHPDVILLSFSVTPWIDSVARLRNYSDEHGVITGKWNLLTGEERLINSLARKSYFAEEEPGFSRDSTEFLHTENFILVDRNGRIRGIYKGTLELDTQHLIEDISQLLKEQPTSGYSRSSWEQIQWRSDNRVGCGVIVR